MNSTFYIFGGYSYRFFVSARKSSKNDIASFDTITKEWKKLGSLNQARRGHRVIFHQGHFVVLGGKKGPLSTERCTLNGDSMQCTTIGPVLEHFQDYPEMMPVPENYCSNNVTI